MASAIQQLIAQQQGPNVLGAIGGAAQTMAALQQAKLAPLQYQQEQQRLDMGKAQLAQLGQQQEQQKRAQLLQLGANTALAIEKAPPEQHAQIYAQARTQAGQMGYDINQLPAEYGDEAKRVLDWSKQQVFGNEQFKTDEDIRKGVAVENAKTKGPASSVGKLMADRAAAKAAGADAATLKSYDDAIAKVGQGQNINLSIIDGQQQLTKPNATKVQENIMNAESALSNLDSIANRFSGDYLTYSGRIKAGAGRLLDKAGMDTDMTKMNATRAQFRNEVNQFFNQYRKDITGAAASEKELEQLKDSILNENMGPAEFKAAYDQFVTKVKGQLEMNKKIARSGVKVSPGKPIKNAKGWLLHQDMNGNEAYVSPDGSEFEEANDAEADQ